VPHPVLSYHPPPRRPTRPVLVWGVVLLAVGAPIAAVAIAGWTDTFPDLGVLLRSLSAVFGTIWLFCAALYLLLAWIHHRHEHRRSAD